MGDAGGRRFPLADRARHDEYYYLAKLTNIESLLAQLTNRAPRGPARGAATATHSRAGGLMSDLSQSRIGQIAVVCKDVARATAFYRDTLGLRFLFAAGPSLAVLRLRRRRASCSRRPSSPSTTIPDRSSTSSSPDIEGDAPRPERARRGIHRRAAHDRPDAGPSTLADGVHRQRGQHDGVDGRKAMIRSRRSSASATSSSSPDTTRA